ncbi:uncharacterized protein Bfra_004389, partial [Botrytis fragariae]
TNVAKLQFNIITSTIISTVDNSLGNLGASIGTIITPRSNTELVARASGEVLNDYESIPIGGISQLTSSVPLTFYNPLTYGGTWRPIMKTDAAALLQQIYGQQAALGFNGSTITSVYLASPVASFKANYASFACYVSITTTVSPGLRVRYRLWHSRRMGRRMRMWRGVAGCGCDGLGLGSSLGRLLGGLIRTVGSIGLIVDNFDANYNCVARKTNSVVAPELCG